jgi:hypothetical protein
MLQASHARGDSAYIQFLQSRLPEVQASLAIYTRIVGLANALAGIRPLTICCAYAMWNMVVYIAPLATWVQRLLRTDILRVLH